MLRHHPARGLTLVELLMGLVVLAILLAIAVPSFQAQMAASQLNSATSALMGSLMQTRAQAIRLGQRVTLCRSNDQANCDNDRTRGWETGWIIFADPTHAASNEAEVSAGDTIVLRSPALPANLRVRGNVNVDDFVSFAANGQQRALGGVGLQMGTIRVCSTSGALTDQTRARHLILNTVGRVVSANPGQAVAINCPAP